MQSREQRDRQSRARRVLRLAHRAGDRETENDRHSRGSANLVDLQSTASEYDEALIASDTRYFRARECKQKKEGRLTRVAFIDN